MIIDNILIPIEGPHSVEIQSTIWIRHGIMRAKNFAKPDVTLQNDVINIRSSNQSGSTQLLQLQLPRFTKLFLAPKSS